MKTSLILCILVSLGTALHSEEYRTFTSTKGAQIRAKLVSNAGGTITIVREDGQQFTLPLTALSPADQEFIRQQASATPAAAPATSATPARPAAPAKIGLGPNDKLSLEDLNSVVGQPLFGNEPLWNSSAAELAERLSLKEESKTKAQSSYRSYTKDDFQMFGAHPYSVALYAENDKVTGLSLVFANKGDLFSSRGSAEKHFDKNTPPAEAAKIVRDAMDKDLATISAALKTKLGEPKKERFGDGKAARMNMLRWDWRGHSILLADAEDEKKQGEYIGIQVVTTAFADAGGKVAHTPDAIIREHAKSNLEHRPSGDVVINDIPMVDQGPKGYCVPATAERAMRFMGIPADMYVLANAGNSGYGGGTSVEVLLEGVGKLIRTKGRSFDSWNGAMKMKEITRSIDKGIPIIWALYSTKPFNETANARLKERADTTDWATWKNKVTAEAATCNFVKDRDTAHVVLIIGYNKDTNEIAFSDSWGEKYKERWITIPEAEKVSQGRFYAIGF